MANPPADHRFPCPACGADLRFDPAKGTLHCDFCGHEEQLVESAPSAIEELDFETALRVHLPEAEMEETRVSRCPNCGAEVAFDDEVHARDCPFCATPVVTGTGTHRHIKPAALLPFALREEDARKALGKWLGGLWFAPNGLAKYARKGRRMNGVYLPYWTFDASTRTAYTGMRGVTRHESYTDSEGKRRTRSRTDWYPAAGRVARDFDDVLALASRSLPGATVDAIEPWDLDALVPYAPDYLAGFSAEGYGIGLEDGHVIARQKMDATIARDVRMDIGGDRQKINSLNTQVSDVTFKHILLPLWLAAFTYSGKSYRVVVNGQSGRVTGERPWSPWKIALAVLAALIVGGAAYYFSQR